MELAVFIQGFLLGLSLIIAIGAQNAFVLKQGLKNQHVFAVCFVCAVSDAILIAIGVFGLDYIQRFIPEIALYAKYFGAIFLFVYGLKSFYSMWKNNNSLQPDEELKQDLWKTIIVCLALTWLNPHVYLDTVILLGSVSTQYNPYSHFFAYGAITASFTFFFFLGYFSRLLRPIFAKPITWKILDGLIGLIMWMIAWKLLV